MLIKELERPPAHDCSFVVSWKLFRPQQKNQVPAIAYKQYPCLWQTLGICICDKRTVPYEWNPGPPEVNDNLSNYFIEVSLQLFPKGKFCKHHHPCTVLIWCYLLPWHLLKDWFSRLSSTLNFNWIECWGCSAFLQFRHKLWVYESHVT